MKAWYDHYSTLTIILSQVSATSAQTTSSLLPSSVKHPLLVTVTSNTRCLSTESYSSHSSHSSYSSHSSHSSYSSHSSHSSYSINFILQVIKHLLHSSKSSLTHCITDLFSALGK